MALQEPQEPQERMVQTVQMALREQQEQQEQQERQAPLALRAQTEQRGLALPALQAAAQMATSTLSLTMRKFTKRQVGRGLKSQI